MMPTQYHTFLTPEQEKILARQRRYSENRACIELYSTDVARILLLYALNEFSGGKINGHSLRRIKTEKQELQQLYDMLLSTQKALRNSYTATLTIEKNQQRKIGKSISNFAIARTLLKTILAKTKEIYETTDVSDYCSQPAVKSRRAIDRAVQSYESRQKAVCTLASNNHVFAKHFVKYYTGFGLEFDERVGEGNVGLMEAAQTFDDRENVRFTTYAAWLIFNAITKAAKNKSRNVRLPSSAYDLFPRFKEGTNFFFNTHFREPSAQELSDLLKEDITVIQNLMQLAKREKSLDCKIGNPCNRTPLTLGDLLQDARKPEIGKTERQRVTPLFAGLLKREQTILKERIGYNDKPKTLEQCGRIYNITPERARQIEKEALKKIALKIKKRRLFKDYGAPLDAKHLRIGVSAIAEPRQKQRTITLNTIIHKIKQIEDITEICDKVYIQ